MAVTVLVAQLFMNLLRELTALTLMVDFREQLKEKERTGGKKERVMEKWMEGSCDGMDGKLAERKVERPLHLMC